MISSTLTAVFSLMALVSANPITKPDIPGDKSKVREIYDWGGQAGTWAENIAVRQSGELLVTLTSAPELYEINPFSDKAQLVHHFDGYTSVLGIAEVAPDVFTVATGNLTSNPITPLPRYFSVWEVDYSGNNHGQARVTKITDLPDAIFLNGLTMLDSKAGTILVVDSEAGHILRLDTKTGNYTVVLDSPFLKPVPGVVPPIGVNGIKIAGNSLYFTNTFQALFGRVRINPATGTATGPFEIVLNNTVSDDFIIRNGVAYLAGNRGNVIFMVDTKGQRQTIAGNSNSTEVAGATAAAFGRTKRDQNVLYFSTAGTEGAVIGGASTWGSVKALDLPAQFLC